MRILFVVPNPPSPVRVRPYQFVHSLVARRHEVTIATTQANEREVLDVALLRREGLSVLAEDLTVAQRVSNLATAYAAGLPLQARYAWQPRLALRLTQVVQQARQAGKPFDTAHVEHLRGTEYALHLRRRLPVVWDSVDCITYLFQQASRESTSRRGRLMTRFELGRTRSYEARLPRMFEHTILSSALDLEVLAGLSKPSPPPPDRRDDVWSVAMTVVPNCIDLARLVPHFGEREHGYVLMTGKMSYHANVTAARYLVDQIMPRVWQSRPDVRVVLAGAEPSREVRELGRRSNGRVQVTGYVDDLRPYFRRATVAVAPLVYCAGTQYKVLEAMATGSPVVATPAAVAALSVKAGEDLLVGDDAQGFAQAVLDLLGDKPRASAIGAAGRAYVERNHRWEDAVVKLESVYQRAIERFKERTS